MTASPKLTVTFKTAAVGGAYTPKNVVAVWIEGPPATGQTVGPFVKTIGRWADIRKDHLAAWIAKAGPNDVDAVSGATRLDHSATLTAEWDLKDKLGALVPDGTYTVRIETADSDATASGQNNQGSFTFVKGLQPQVQSNLTGGSAAPYMVTLDFNPTAGECNNNIVDPGETCDPPGSCPVSCEAMTVSACMPAVLTGSAANCTAACSIAAITECINDDGCCADGCTVANDSDCGGDGATLGGCSAGDDSSGAPLIAFGMLGAAVLVTRRRRR